MSYNARVGLEEGIDHVQKLFKLLSDNPSNKEAHDLCKKVILTKEMLISDMSADLATYRQVLRNYDINLPATQTVLDKQSCTATGKRRRATDEEGSYKDSCTNDSMLPPSKKCKTIKLPATNNSKGSSSQYQFKDTTPSPPDDTTRPNWPHFNKVSSVTEELVRPVPEGIVDLTDETLEHTTNKNLHIIPPNTALPSSSSLKKDSVVLAISPDPNEPDSEFEYDSDSDVDLYSIPQFKGSGTDSDSIVEVSRTDFDNAQAAKKQLPNQQEQNTAKDEHQEVRRNPQPVKPDNYESAPSSADGEEVIKLENLEELIWELWSTLFPITSRQKDKNSKTFEQLGGSEWYWSYFLVLAKQEGYEIQKGKLDRRTVPEIARAMSYINQNDDSRAEQQKREDLLRRLWMRLLPDLKVSEIKEESDFFQIGGYSLIIAQLTHWARTEGYILLRVMVSKTRKFSKMARRLVLKEEVEDLQARLKTDERAGKEDKKDNKHRYVKCSAPTTKQQQPEPQNDSRKRKSDQVNDNESDDQGRDRKRVRATRNSIYLSIETPVLSPSLQSLFDRGIVLVDGDDNKTSLNFNDFAVKDAVHAHQESQDVINMINRLIEVGRRFNGNPGYTVRFINRLAIRYEYQKNFDKIGDSLQQSQTLQDRGSPLSSSARREIRTRFYQPVHVTKIPELDDTPIPFSAVIKNKSTKMDHRSWKIAQTNTMKKA